MIKTSERRHWRHPNVFIVNFQHILHIFLVFLLLTLSSSMPAGQPLLELYIFKELFVERMI